MSILEEVINELENCFLDDIQLLKIWIFVKEEIRGDNPTAKIDSNIMDYINRIEFYNLSDYDLAQGKFVQLSDLMEHFPGKTSPQKFGQVLSANGITRVPHRVNIGNDQIKISKTKEGYYINEHKFFELCQELKK